MVLGQGNRTNGGGSLYAKYKGHISNLSTKKSSLAIPLLNLPQI
jgi:hypothetical protein